MKERSRGYCDKCGEQTRHLKEEDRRWKCMMCGVVQEVHQR